MSAVLGIDTSNYTTSAALYRNGQIIQQKQLLPVKAGTLGLRQSDAVFHHVQQLPLLLETLFSGESEPLTAIGVSVSPRDAEGSYMPCFTVGHGAARQLSALLHIPYHSFSHQCGHIMAALFSAGQMKLRLERFLAFHVSGGTTEALLVTPDASRIIKTECVAGTLDLNAGQAVDRVGGLLGLSFPAGPALEELAKSCRAPVKARATIKGADCCLSGLENQCRDLLSRGTSRETVARFCLDTIQETLVQMTEKLLERYGFLPLLFSGGVMSNTLIRAHLTARFRAHFAEPAFSADNAAGVAVLAALREEGEG